MGAKTGPKRVPAAILALRGAKIAGKRAAEEVKYGGVPVPPKAITARAREVWDDVLPKLTDVGIVAEVDSAAIWAYCESVATAEKCTAELEQAGALVVSTEKSGDKAHPLLAVRDAAFSQIRRLADEFGFTPASRSSVHRNENSDRKPKNQGPSAEDFVQLAPEVAHRN